MGLVEIRKAVQVASGHKATSTGVRMLNEDIKIAKEASSIQRQHPRQSRYNEMITSIIYLEDPCIETLVGLIKVSSRLTLQPHTISCRVKP